MRVHYQLHRRASVKDIIESLGIPHTGIGVLKSNNQMISFEYIPEAGDDIEVHSFEIPIDFSKNPLLRPSLSPNDYKFAADVNVGKLARLLRMLGVDTYYKNGLSDGELSEIAHKERRILLTKDLRLLMRSILQYGYLVKSVRPEDQLVELTKNFGLKDHVKPFSRCMLCNGLLVPIEKQSIIHRLEPKTKLFYQTFYICRHCDRIYWAGSHKTGMETLIDKILKTN